MAQDYPPEVRQFVEEMIFDYLDSVRKSQQVEDQYQALPRSIKQGTTKQIREMARRAAGYVLTNVDSIEALGTIDSDSVVRNALVRALSDD